MLLRPTTVDDENMEDLLRGVFREMKSKAKPKTSARSGSKYKNPNPFSPGEGEVLVASENEDGTWEVS